MLYSMLPIKDAQISEALHSSHTPGSAGFKAVEKTIHKCYNRSSNTSRERETHPWAQHMCS